MDIVINEINQFFQILKFNKVVINNNENFEYHGEYYMLTKDGNNYYLECALTLEEAKKRWHEDMGAYSAKLYSPEEIIEIIKNDILRFVINTY